MEPEKERNIRWSFISHSCRLCFSAEWNLTDYNQGKAIAQLPQIRHQVHQNQKLKQETQSQLASAGKSSASSLEGVGSRKVSNSK